MIIDKKDAIWLTESLGKKLTVIRGDVEMSDMPDNKLMILNGNFVYNYISGITPDFNESADNVWRFDNL